MTYEGESLSNLQRESIAIDIPNEALRVNVVAGGSSGGSGSVNIPADILKDYQLQDVNKNGSTTYLGKIMNGGSWFIVRIIKVDSNNTNFRFANISNNSSYTTLTDAWTNRVTLTYELLNELSFAGAGTIPVSEVKITDNEKIIIDESTAGTIYVGRATIGTATTSATWQIQRTMTVANITTVEWADGNIQYDNVWDNRGSLSYS